MASRTLLLPRKAKDTLLTPPLISTPGRRCLISLHRVDVIHGIVRVGLDAGAHGEDVGIEDDVFGGETELSR